MPLARFCARDCSENPFCTLRKKIATQSPPERPNYYSLNIVIKLLLAKFLFGRAPSGSGFSLQVLNPIRIGFPGFPFQSLTQPLAQNIVMIHYFKTNPSILLSLHDNRTFRVHHHPEGLMMNRYKFLLRMFGRARFLKPDE
ncbi:MAG: hypothetical protein JWN56_1243 [Sphingobacteriales bacterium]|nr:hypothetical protein [Sphingobacteriales bacterium]